MVSKSDIEQMRRLSADIRIETIRALAHAGFGHIGGAMSIADVLGVLYGGAMRIRPQEPEWEDRDYLVVSKGHAGPAVYAALALSGYFPKDWLRTINQSGTRLPSHCDRLKTPGIDMTTGSLGQGISCAMGIALGIRMLKKQNVVYCIIGDGEMEEGQVWEAVEAAAHQRLSNLILFVDYNKKQLDGRIVDIVDPIDIPEKFRAFGWNARQVVGYDAQDILSGLTWAWNQNEKPTALVLDTYKGLGCSFAEAQEFNHYMNIDFNMAEAAVAEIERRYALGTFPRGDFLWQ